MSPHLRRSLRIVAAVCVWGVASAAVTPPEQPTEGPGSSDYGHASVTVSDHGVGGERYWLYEPAEPTPERAPVVVYLHGYGWLQPGPYVPFLEHLARRGYTVVHLRYGGLLDVWAYEGNAVRAITDALARLAGPGHVAPEPGAFALVGHSLGGMLALRLAHVAAERDLPTPLAVVLHDGAGADTPAAPFLPLDDLSGVDPAALVVFIVAGESIDDTNAVRVVRDGWLGTVQVPRARRNVLVLRSDRHGEPELRADHDGVIADWAGRPLDAIDWYGHWRPTEAALAEAFYGVDGEYVLGDGPEVRSMGEWSDGTLVRIKGTASDLGL